MKKIIKRFWGVGLIIIIMSSLLVVTPVSADDNEWVSQSAPGGPNYQLASGSDVADFAVYGTGDVIYAVTGTGNNTIYKSTNGGVGWTKLTQTSPALPDMYPDMVAVAPDDSNRVAIADVSLGIVRVSVNGGTTFSTISPVAVTGGNSLAVIKDLTISPLRLGANYVTVCGTNNGATGVVSGAVFYYNLGAVVGQAWTEKRPINTDIVAAVAFSPNFVSDLTMVAVSANTSTGSENITLQVYSFSSNNWNTADYTGYPVQINTLSTAFASISASLALDPAYLGGEDTLRNAFIGIDTNTSSIDGIYRVLNTQVRNLSGGNIYSVAYDGTTLVAGQQDSTTVFRSLDPMSSVPTVTGSSTLKSPGGTGNTVVGFVGANVVAGTSGANSAFAVSRSSGSAFNDISLIDTALTTANDVAVAADSTKVYYVTNNGAYVSLWLKTTAWERVLSFAYANPVIARLAPNNPDVIYLGEVGGTRVYFSKDVQSRWYQRTCTTTIADLAVEADAVSYVLNSSGSVVKSANEGFIWSGQAVATGLTNGYSLTSVKENVILAGGTAGKVAHSQDGGTTWTVLPGTTENGAGNVIVIPDEAYATNSIIYAATNTAGMNIMQWTIGTSTAWTDIYNLPGSAPPTAMQATQGCYGLAMKGGILYALTVGSGTDNSTLEQYIPSVKSWARKVAAAYVPTYTAFEKVTLGSGSASHNALKASTGSNKLWALKTNGTQALYMLNDTLATAAPALSGPADKVSININPQTGASDVVVLSWSRAANAAASAVALAYDSAFTQTVPLTTSTPSFPTLNSVIGGPGTLNGVYLGPGKTYYWRVRGSAASVTAPALPDGLNSPWSQVRSLTVQPMAAAVPGVSSPVNGSTIQSQNPAFSWSPVAGTTKYEFQLSVGPVFATTVYSDFPGSTGTIIPDTITLDKGKQYFWRVRALEPIQGDWSAVANFMIAVPVTTTAAPPVTITQVPAPTFTIPPAPAPTTVTLTPPAVEQIAPTYIWAIIIIGAILVIAVIVLIVRTRRSV